MQTIITIIYLILALSIFVISVGSFITGFIILKNTLKSLFNNCDDKFDKFVVFCAIIFLFPILISFSMAALLLSFTIIYEATKYSDFLLQYECFNSIYEFFKYYDSVK